MKKALKRRIFLKSAILGVGAGLTGIKSLASDDMVQNKDIRIGLVGLSVHSAAFSQILNDPAKKSDLNGCKMVALYHPKGNPDVDFTAAQLAGFEAEIKKMGVKIVSSMNEMLNMVDAVMIETNDGRPHMEEVLPAIKAGKPVFVDKPVAQNLAEVIRIYDVAKKSGVPIFSSSALRYVDNAMTINPENVLSAFTFSPAALEKSHTDLFWYGIHGVELLYTVMGSGCKEVMQVQHTDSDDLVTGFWNKSRVGTFRGIRSGKRSFGGTVFTEKDIITLDSFTGYRSLVVKVVEFFKTRIAPVSPEETIEIYAFMEAAQESKQNGGVKVSIDKVLANARNSIK